MVEYIYLPVPTPEMTDQAKNMRNVYTENKRTPPTILRNFFGEGPFKRIGREFAGCLRTVTPRDRIYLILHGSGKAGSEAIGADRNLIKNKHVPLGLNGRYTPGRTEKIKGYTPAAIAAILKKEGLSNAFVDLVILSCGSGLEGTDRTEASKSIAQRISESMRELKYHSIKVTGYTGEVKIRYGSKPYAIDVKGRTGGMYDPSERERTF